VAQLLADTIPGAVYREAPDAEVAGVVGAFVDGLETVRA
jgi:hypothetical protein